MTIFSKINGFSQIQRRGAIAIVGAFSLLLIANISNASNDLEIPELEPLTIDTEAERDGDHPWIIDRANSSLKIRINQNGNWVEGAFTNWKAQINFDPENLETAFVDARIDIASLQLGDLTEHATSADFLNVDGHSQARFLSDFFWLRGDGKVDAEGLLEIAGIAKPFVLTFALGIDGDKAFMKSYTALNRIDYGIGAEKYADEKSIAHGVEVAIDLMANKDW